jgi:signal transduction histidine kinase/CheY-like chemotaxis protein
MDQASDYQSDIRISPIPVIVFLFLVAIIALILASIPYGLEEKIPIVVFSISVALLGGLSWKIYTWNPLAGRWLTLFSTAFALYLCRIWLDWQAIFTLSSILVALAAALLNVRVSFIFAVFETILLITIYFLGGGITWMVMVTSLLVIWLMWLILYAIYFPMTQASRWVKEYYEAANQLREEAYARQLELGRVLQGLEDANNQLTRLNQLAQGLRKYAEDARTAKEQFVANVSHELRTPLNMIIGFTDMILQAPQTYGKKIPGTLLADLTVIQRNAEHLSDLINDVLDLSQIEADQMALTKEMATIDEIINFSTIAVLPLFKLKGLYLRCEIAPGIPEIFCDRTRLREVFLNLLSNAGRFTDSGGVTVRAWQEDQVIHVSIQDTGPGISSQDQTRLFHPFEQLDSSIRRRYGGTGLGLAISKRFIELHDGKIWVESELGAGTTFHFQLPLQTIEPAASHIPRWIHPYLPIEERAHLPRIQKKNILPRFVVLEEGLALQKLLTRYFGEVEIVHVKSLEEAQASMNGHPAQALLVNSPTIGKTLDSFQAQTIIPLGTPTFVCSIPEVIEEASVSMGVAGILIKPISRAKLIQKLEAMAIYEGQILIVDDEPDALQLFSRMLASSGRNYRILLARDGQDALNILEECRPDVILLDLIMPNINGFKILQLREHDARLQGIPMIVISARNPVGHPVISQGLAVSQVDGLSVNQLMTCIQAFSQILSVTVTPGDLMQPVNPID